MSCDVVGRGRELAVLHQLVEDDVGPSLVGLVGEPGIGKTHLLDEGVRLAQATGCPVARTRGLGDVGAPPLWPWGQVLEGLGAPECVGGGSSSADEIRRRLLQAVDRPTLVVIDDLHQLDASSLALLVDLVEVQPIPGLRILVASRPEVGADVDGVLSSVQHRGRLLRLAGLDVEDCEALIGAEVDGRALHAATGGNPFHLIQVGRDSTAGVDSLAQALTRRWDQLSDRVRLVLEVAALLGTECEIEPIHAAAGVGRDVVGAAIDEAVGLDLVRRVGTGRMAFAHDLIRAHAIGEVDGNALRDRHRAIARVLRERAAAAPEFAGAVAHHVASVGDDPEGTLLWARRAGDHALVVGAPADAARQFAVGLCVAADVDSGPEVLSDLHLLHGEALLGSGNRPAAVAAFRSASDLAREIGDSRRLADGLVGQQRCGVADGAEGLLDDLQRSADLLLADDDPQAATVLRSIVEGRIASGTDPGVLAALAQQATGVAHRTRHRGAALDAAFAHRLALSGAPSGGPLAGATAELRRQAEAVGDVSALHDAMAFEVADALIAGDRFGLRRSVSAIASLAEVDGARRMRRLADAHRASLALLEGSIGAASSAIEDLGRWPDSEDAVALMGLHLDRLRGEFDPRRIERLLDSAPMAPLHRSLVPWAHAAMGDLVEARHGLDRCLAGGILDDVGPTSSTAALPFLAEACWMVGAVEHAPVLFARLEPFAGRCFVAGTGDDLVWSGPAALSLGLLAAIDPTLGDADALLRSAERTAHGLGARPTLDLLERARSARRPTTGSTAGPSPRQVALDRTGSTWTYRRGEIAMGLRHRKGLDQLVVLLRRPGREVHAVDLVAAGAGGGRTVAGAEDLVATQGSPGLDVFDDQARDAYRRRYEDLTSDLAEADAWNDEARASLLRGEIDALAHELERGIGLGGRPRTTGSTAEKARVNATRTLKAAIESIGEHDPLVADHLTRSIRTGTYCAYEPIEPGFDWILGG